MAKGDKKTPAPQTVALDLGDLEARLAQAAGAGSTNKARAFIGGGATWDQEAQIAANTPTRKERTQRYVEGAEWMAVEWSPRERQKVQERLMDLGLLDEDFNDGVWDDKSRAAFSSILELANGYGVDWVDAMNEYEKSFPMEYDPKTGQARRKIPKKNGTGATRPALRVSYSNPTDLGDLADEVALKRLGRRLKPEERQGFIGHYQGIEQSAQAAAHAASGEGGGSYTEAMDAETAANKYAERIDPVASSARNMIPLIEGVNELLSGFGRDTTRPEQI